jgi:hypothetical protein
MFDNGEAATDFPNMLQPLGATTTITQGDQAGEDIQPAPPPLLPNIWGGNMGGAIGGRNMWGPATGDQEYSGITTALLCMGHTMYNLATIYAELAIQLAIDPGEPNTCAPFRDFVVNVQQSCVYLAWRDNRMSQWFTPLACTIQSRHQWAPFRGKSGPSLGTDVQPKNQTRCAYPLQNHGSGILS